MKEISLTQGYVALVDDEDFENVSKHKWRIAGRNRLYAITGQWRKKSVITLHVFVLGAKESMEIDHCNRNGLDCRKENLRHCTHGENMRNRRRHTNNRSGYKGIYWRENQQRYMAQIRHNGQKIHLGSFTSKELAAQAYDAAAKRLFGSFASPNFI